MPQYTYCARIKHFTPDQAHSFTEYTEFTVVDDQLASALRRLYAQTRLALSAMPYGNLYLFVTEHENHRQVTTILDCEIEYRTIFI